jgi:hypothetical protein
MKQNTTADNTGAEHELVTVIDTHLTGLLERIPPGTIHKTLRRWLAGHAEPPEDEASQGWLVAMAADLEIFTPSLTGRIMMERHLRSVAPATEVERQAVQALGAARFRLVRIMAREDAELVRLEDLVTQESVLLLDDGISPLAAGMACAMRLCPLANGRHVLVSPLFAIDEAMLARAMTFVRPGRGLGDGHRCAASLYRDAARGGFMPVPLEDDDLDEEEFFDVLREAEAQLMPVQKLAIRWIIADEDDAELIQAARQLASADTLVDVLGSFAQTEGEEVEALRAAFERIASVQVETMALRARTGLADGGTLDRVAAEIEGHIARGAMQSGARDLLERLRLRWRYAEGDRAGGAAPGGATSGRAAELDAVIARIQALRARTVERGCTEAEAMAAAAKIAELLDKHDLTLDEISVRNSDCEGVRVATGRKRRAPVDGCMPPVAAFCDCRVWSEQGEGGVLRYVFFGLKADVQAARFLHDVIEDTFETESAAFRRGAIYQGLRGSDRRVALTSFQTGLAGGIADKLDELKAARRGAGAGGTGFDLVALKQSVVEEEMERLGVLLTSRSSTSRGSLHGRAYAAGKEAGARFEPHTFLER